MEKKVWLIAVNMGYGHQRTADSLRKLSWQEEVINANDYRGIPKRDKLIWERARKFYENISRFSRIPFFGKIAFSIYDQFQKILNFYPKRDLSQPNFILRNLYSLFKKGWGKDLIENLKLKNPHFPILTTFFTPAFMAEYFGYPGEIFCVVCDTDVARTWAPFNPQKSKIKYFAPTERVVERLKLYGLKPENIFLTGYPLPLENIGSENLEILKRDLKHRILNLDPKGKYREKYRELINYHLGRLPEKSDHLLTIMFSVGGAGAQKEIGAKIIRNLSERIQRGEIKIILSTGVNKKVKEFFEKEIAKLSFGDGKNNIEILYQEKIEYYFQEFNRKLRKTDILWTKPSELSFYTALGIPIIIAPPLGSQEEYNKRWILKSGFGFLQENLNYINQWLFDWLENGFFAEAAMEGFIEGEKLGTLKIQKIIEKNL